MNDTTTIFVITIEDVQFAATAILNRVLTRTEMKFIEDHIDEYLPWFDGVTECIKAGQAELSSV